MNNEMTSGNIFGKSSPVLFCLCLMVFAGIGLITFRDYDDGSWLCRTNWFWWRLLWFDVIFAVFWFSIFGFPVSRLLQKRTMTGATYAIVETICLRAALVSFVIWGIDSFVSTDTRFSVLPIVGQLLVALYFGVVAFMFHKTQALQADSMRQPSKAGLPSPLELANRLEAVERRLGLSGDSQIVKRLKEKIRYSLPNVGRIARCDAYRQLVERVVQIADAPSIDVAQYCKDAEEHVRVAVELCKQ